MFDLVAGPAFQLHLKMKLHVRHLKTGSIVSQSFIHTTPSSLTLQLLELTVPVFVGDPDTQNEEPDRKPGVLLRLSTSASIAARSRCNDFNVCWTALDLDRPVRRDTRRQLTTKNSGRQCVGCIVATPLWNEWPGTSRQAPAHTSAPPLSTPGSPPTSPFSERPGSASMLPAPVSGRAVLVRVSERQEGGKWPRLSRHCSGQSILTPSGNAPSASKEPEFILASESSRHWCVELEYLALVGHPSGRMCWAHTISWPAYRASSRPRTLCSVSAHIDFRPRPSAFTKSPHLSPTRGP